MPTSNAATTPASRISTPRFSLGRGACVRRCLDVRSEPQCEQKGSFEPVSLLQTGHFISHNPQTQIHKVLTVGDAILFQKRSHSPFQLRRPGAAVARFTSSIARLRRPGGATRTASHSTQRERNSSLQYAKRAERAHPSP